MKMRVHPALMAGILTVVQAVLIASAALPALGQPADDAAKQRGYEAAKKNVLKAVEETDGQSAKHNANQAAKQAATIAAGGVPNEAAAKNANVDARKANKDAARKLVQTSANAGPPEVADLPITELPQDQESTDMLGLLISGDGGWWGLDDTVSKVLAAHGIPVIGISSHRYFSKPRTPDETASDMYRALRFYMKKWNKQRIVLLGYSLGAEIVPFVATRVPEDLRDKLAMLVMIGPTAETMFEFHMTDWVVSPTKRNKFPVQPEIEKVKGPKLLCVASSKDDECICDKLDPKSVTELKRDGNHHFNDDFKGLAAAIWEKVKAATTPVSSAPAPAVKPAGTTTDVSAPAVKSSKAAAPAPAPAPAAAAVPAGEKPESEKTATAKPPKVRPFSEEMKGLAQAITKKVKEVTEPPSTAAPSPARPAPRSRTRSR